MKNYQSIDAGGEEDAEGEGSALAVECPRPDSSSPDRNPHPEDHLCPPFDSPSRPSNLFVGAFNLVATVVGGAVLSLPVVFRKCGVAFTTLAMVLSAYLTYASLAMLCHSARRGGGSSYGEVVRSAFGKRAEEGVSWLLFAFLAFVLVGYDVLLKDIWTPLARELAGVEGADEDRVLLCVLGLLLPFALQRSLHALRYNCYVGSASIFVLCVALCRGGLMRRRGEVQDSSYQIEYFKVPSPEDALFSFPIVTCAFLCHFNIIAIQNALQRPTRERMDKLTKTAIFLCFCLMYAFGLGGYLYGGSDTQGNILLNVPTSRDEEGGQDATEYYLFLLGRIGCGTTIAFAVPMIALPCREALLEVVDVKYHDEHHVTTTANQQSAEVASSGGGGEKWYWKLCHRCNRSETERDATISAEDEVTEVPGEIAEAARTDSPLLVRLSSSSFRSSVILRHDPIQRDYVFRNTLAHWGSTLLIFGTCYFAAVAVRGVEAVWSLIGSGMAFLLAFVLPCGCFLVIEGGVPGKDEGGDRRDGWISLARAMLAFAIVGAVVCTVNNTVGFG
ncbi:hypothetical protein ACHAWF_008376 [Thalassiosira exigua]